MLGVWLSEVRSPSESKVSEKGVLGLAERPMVSSLAKSLSLAKIVFAGGMSVRTCPQLGNCSELFKQLPSPESIIAQASDSRCILAPTFIRNWRPESERVMT